MPSMNARGLSRTDVLTGLAGLVVLGCVGVSLVLADPTGRTERLSESIANLRAIGAAIGQYRADNNGHLPIEWVTRTRRPSPDGRGLAGFTTWQFGGKNNHPYWYNAIGGGFDIEAADRPLNSYLYPDYTFYAPPAPARLPANDPTRLTTQARVFRDPADVTGRQRNWPNANPTGISGYDDIGTSYHAQMDWYSQLNPSGLVDLNDFREGTRRLAVEQGVDPSRFVHAFDEFADIVLYAQPGSQIQGNHGTTNQSVTLFADGHTGLVTFRPGRTRESRINADYSVWFEDLGRPAPTRMPRAASR